MRAYGQNRTRCEESRKQTRTTTWAGKRGVTGKDGFHRAWRKRARRDGKEEAGAQ